MLSEMGMKGYLGFSSLLFLGLPLGPCIFPTPSRRHWQESLDNVVHRFPWDIKIKQSLSASALLGNRISEIQEWRGRGKELWKHGKMPPPPLAPQWWCFTGWDATSLNATVQAAWIIYWSKEGRRMCAPAPCRFLLPVVQVCSQEITPSDPLRQPLESVPGSMVLFQMRSS